MVETDIFIQVKIDYIQYMMQIYKTMAYDETNIGIRFALMLENYAAGEEGYLTVDDLEVRTGFSRPTITDALSRISNISNEFPIFQTKKPHDRKKYYYCLMTLESYFRDMFLTVTTASDLSMEFIPELLSRLDALSSQTESVLHIRRTLLYLYTAIHYYKEIFEKSEALLDRMFENSEFIPDFSSFLEEIKTTRRFQETVPKNDNLLDIKRIFISNMVKMSTDLIGGNEELIAVFLTLFLENEPVTQDEIMIVTKSNRTKVSQALTTMEDLKVVQVTKKTGDRKKYYKGATNIQTYGIGKLSRVQGYYTQIQTMMQKKFLADLEKRDVTEKRDKEEKKRLKEFFEKNIFYYNTFIKFSTAMHKATGDKLQKVIDLVK